MRPMTDHPGCSKEVLRTLYRPYGRGSIIDAPYYDSVNVEVAGYRRTPPSKIFTAGRETASNVLLKPLPGSCVFRAQGCFNFGRCCPPRDGAGSWIKSSAAFSLSEDEKRSRPRSGPGLMVASTLAYHIARKASKDSDTALQRTTRMFFD